MFNQEAQHNIEITLLLWQDGDNAREMVIRKIKIDNYVGYPQP